MSYDKIYQKLREKYTDEEIAESMMIPADLSEEEAKQAAEELKRIRFERLSSMSEEQRIFSDLMRLRIQMEDYVEKEEYQIKKSFGSYLEEYIRIVKRTKKSFSEEIKIHNTRLSRLLKNKEEPNIELSYRLEKHSGELISALLWWKLLIKKQEYEIKTDTKRRENEQNKVKNAFQFRA